MGDMMSGRADRIECSFCSWRFMPDQICNECIPGTSKCFFSRDKSVKEVTISTLCGRHKTISVDEYLNSNKRGK